jgi:Aminoglycoside-2''-adenylyltransferase
MDASFDPVLAVAEVMRNYPCLWFVSGGWAIDLFLHRVTRDHSDIEIGIYRRDQDSIRQFLAGWSMEKVIQTAAGGKWFAWEENERLELPIHQARAKRLQPEPLEFELFLNEREETHWISRRHPEIIRPVDQVVLMSFLNIPILAPEIQLLFKAKQTRGKDQKDFENTLPHLSPNQRRWLAGALDRSYPNHPWRIGL